MANERLLLLPKTIKLFDFGEGCDRTCWYFEGDTSGGLRLRF
ncbi:asr0674 [Nostoc sp. PCC 7120 = FACHB-418]|nr:asr0674 [Nostoc sp. PCC 7120 = FACHB-418]